MPPLDATVGGANANSYVDRASAVVYFATRLVTAAWDAADQPTQERALMAATARLEQEEYVGCRASTGQALKWPRLDITDDDGTLLPTNAIPVPVARATCELALALLASGTTDALAPTGLEAFQSVSVGGLTVTPAATAPAAGALPPQVRRLLRRWLTTSTGTTRVVRS